MEELNTTKLSTLITTEPTEDQYAKYAAKVAEWTKEAYDNYAFKLYRPDARLSRDEDKYLYSMEVTILKNGTLSVSRFTLGISAKYRKTIGQGYSWSSNSSIPLS